VTDASIADVCAVVVAYQPEIDAIRDLLTAVIPQVGSVVIVDNGSPAWRDQVPEMRCGPVELISMATNAGLAAAQNTGIAVARERGYRYVLLLDQDSVPVGPMVDELMRALASSSPAGAVAALGPASEDAFGGGRAPFIRIGFPMNRKLRCDRTAPPVRCDFLISSGSLIPLQVIDAIGPMDEGLFIDNVDLEWCFRARARGYQLYGVCGATMQHRLGDTRRLLPLSLGSVVVHGPSRLYYMMRNRLLLYRLPHTPWVWIAQDIPRALVKLALFTLLIGPRLKNLRFMMRGLWDGLCRRTGPCPIR
jgi:rhamnosyltransferase